MRRTIALLALAALFDWTAAHAADEESPLLKRLHHMTQILPNGGRPETKIPFPDITDWSSLRITLDRGSSFVTAPVYRIAITGDGTVIYEGEDHVAIPGRHTARIPREQVRALFEKFRDAQFFWMLNDYQGNISDNPTNVIAISFDGHSQRVRENAGSLIGMPPEIETLMDAVDAAAQSRDWTDGSAQALAWMRATHWDFRSRDDANLGLIAGAAERDNTGFLRYLLAAGVPANTKFGCEGVTEAARWRDGETVHLLLDAGAPVHVQPATHWIDNANTGEENLNNEAFYRDYCDALLGAASNGAGPEIVAAVLARHRDVNLGEFINGRTALMELASYDVAERRAATLQSMRLLLAAGADPWRRDRQGRTALDGATPEAAALLRDWMAAHPRAGAP